MSHALISGKVGVGKSTLISRVLDNLNVSVKGFETRKEVSMQDENKGSPVFIYRVGEEKFQSDENLIGWQGSETHITYVETFEKYADFVDSLDDCDVIKFDELGFMESECEKFCGSVLKKFDGDIPVIAAVKNAPTEFLEKVRNHPKCKLFTITEENRDDLVNEVTDYLKAQLQ